MIKLIYFSFRFYLFFFNYITISSFPFLVGGYFEVKLKLKYIFSCKPLLSLFSILPREVRFHFTVCLFSSYL